MFQRSRKASKNSNEGSNTDMTTTTMNRRRSRSRSRSRHEEESEARGGARGEPSSKQETADNHGGSVLLVHDVVVSSPSSPTTTTATTTTKTTTMVHLPPAPAPAPPIPNARSSAPPRLASPQPVITIQNDDDHKNDNHRKNNSNNNNNNIDHVNPNTINNTYNNAADEQAHHDTPHYILDIAPRPQTTMTTNGVAGVAGGGESTTLGGHTHGSTSTTTFGDAASLVQNAKWRRRTLRLLERSAEQQHEQARRLGHDTSEHYWKLALRTTAAPQHLMSLGVSPSSVAAAHEQLLWYPSLLSDLASVESVLGGAGSGGVGGRDHHMQDDHSTTTRSVHPILEGGDEDDEQSHKSLFSRSKQALRRYSICSSSFSRSDYNNNNNNNNNDVESILGLGSRGDSSVRAMKRGVRRGKREHNESANKKSKHSHAAAILYHHSSAEHLPSLHGIGSASFDGETTQSSLPAAAATATHKNHTKRGAAAAAAWRKHRPRLWFGNNHNNNPHHHHHPSSSSSSRDNNNNNSHSHVPNNKNKKNRNSLPYFLGDISAYIGPLDEADADAWMCGVCGRAFATLEAAEKHEQDHIQRVVDTLPWKVAARPTTTTNTTTATTLPIKNTKDKALASPGGGGAFAAMVSPESMARQRTKVTSNLAFLREGEEDEDEEESLEKRDNHKWWLFQQEKAPPRRRQTIERPTKVNDKPKQQYVKSLPSDLLDEILEGEHPDHEQQYGGRGSLDNEDMLVLEHSSQLMPANDDRRLSYAVVDEEEKQEIEYTGHDERRNAYSTRLQPIQPDSSLMDEKDTIGYDPDQQNPLTRRLPSPALTQDWPDNNEFLLHDDALVPRMRSEARLYSYSYPDGEEEEEEEEDQRHSSVPYRIDQLSHEHSMQYTEEEEPQDALLLSSAVRDYVILADEALMNVCEKARGLILSPEEFSAERQLALLARDKLYYDDLAKRSHYRKSPALRHRHEGHGIVGKMQNKFLDAYQLMKEGADRTGFRDEYKARNKKNSNVQGQKLVVHDQATMYLNVMVKNGIQVVKNELERLAQERWEKAEEIEKFTRFERFRVYAHVNLVRLAGLALSSDFTPRRIAVQLSNDIYRLLTPRLKRRGVTIETEIEYRVGPYFVLAVNVLRIDWRQLLKATHKVVRLQHERWERSQEEEKQHHLQQQQDEGGDHQPPPHPSLLVQCKEYLIHLYQLTRLDFVAHIFSWLYRNTHWLFYQPLCILCYHTFFGSLIRHFILSSVSDEIFYYVEEKGMEMEIRIRHASVQAAFMLSALREIRADSKDHKEKQQQGKEGGKENILGPLLGPSIPADKEVVEPPPGFEVPEHLEFLGLELDVPVGFRRLRWALLSDESSFITEALYRVEAKYENITMGTWNKHREYIGSTKKLPDGVKEEDFIGAEKVGSYLMPKSAFVKANMCTETHYIVAYNDYCFTLKKRALTPDVPYGSTFVAWTQFTVINTGHDSCRLQFSVEPEFPNGPPMVSRQIKSGMRAGVGQLFVLIHETIAKYADEYP
ncbi:hypothetical protein ACA910_021520 [Epithemia clementina (nom. ined.)]